MAGGNLDDDQITKAALGTLAERVSSLEAMTKEARSDRTRMEREMRELRQEVKEGFDEFRKALTPLVTMATASKMLLALMFACITAAGVLFAIADRVWSGIAGR